jgi:hypothetical protein
MTITYSITDSVVDGGAAVNIIGINDAVLVPNGAAPDPAIRGASSNVAKYAISDKGYAAQFKITNIRRTNSTLVTVEVISNVRMNNSVSGEDISLGQARCAITFNYPEGEVGVAGGDALLTMLQLAVRAIVPTTDVEAGVPTSATLQRLLVGGVEILG